MRMATSSTFQPMSATQCTGLQTKPSPTRGKINEGLATKKVLLAEVEPRYKTHYRQPFILNRSTFKLTPADSTATLLSTKIVMSAIAVGVTRSVRVQQRSRRLSREIPLTETTARLVA